MSDHYINIVHSKMKIDPINFQPIELSFYFFVIVSVIYIQNVESTIIKFAMIILFTIVLVIHYNRYNDMYNYISHKSDTSTTMLYLFTLVGVYSVFVYYVSKMTNDTFKILLMILVGLLMGYGMYITYKEKEQQLTDDYEDIEVNYFSKNIDIPILLLYVILLPYVLENEMVWFTFLIGDMFYHVIELYIYTN